MNADIAVVILIALALVCGATAFVLMRRWPNQRHVLAKWARQSGFRIIAARRRWWRCGPFTFLRSTAQGVFRIAVTDPGGNTLKGYARVGAFWGLGDYVTVAWDRDPESDVNVPDVEHPKDA